MKATTCPTRLTMLTWERTTFKISEILCIKQYYEFHANRCQQSLQQELVAHFVTFKIIQNHSDMQSPRSTPKKIPKTEDSQAKSWPSLAFLLGQEMQRGISRSLGAIDDIDEQLVAIEARRSWILMTDQQHGYMMLPILRLMNQKDVGSLNNLNKWVCTLSIQENYKKIWGLYPRFTPCPWISCDFDSFCISSKSPTEMISDSSHLPDFFEFPSFSKDSLSEKGLGLQLREPLLPRSRLATPATPQLEMLRLRDGLREEIREICGEWYDTLWYCGGRNPVDGLSMFIPVSTCFNQIRIDSIRIWLKHVETGINMDKPSTGFRPIDDVFCLAENGRLQREEFRTTAAMYDGKCMMIYIYIDIYDGIELL